MLYPLKFHPRLLPKIWGGRKLQTHLAHSLPENALIGESWELYDFPPGQIEGNTTWLSSLIANGPHAGRSLHDLITEFGPSLMGDVPLHGPHGQFPLLFKFLDARENLSVQVHPSPDYAARHPEAHLKTEAWYVIHADPGAQIYKDLHPGVTRDQFQSALDSGAVEALLKTHPAKPGHTFFLPSGTVHALGAGALVAEVQTPSDTTFRIFDFNRIDPTTGRPRPLHIPQALECINFDQPPPPPPPRSHVAGYFTTVTRLVTSDHFIIEKVRFTEGVEEPIPYDQPVVWMFLDGQAQVKVDTLREPLTLARGQTVLLPAQMRNPTIKTLTDCTWLEITFPTPPI